MWNTASSSLLMKAGAASSGKRCLHSLLQSSAARTRGPLSALSCCSATATNAATSSHGHSHSSAALALPHFSEMQQRTGLALLAHCCQSAASSAADTHLKSPVQEFQSLAKASAWNHRLIGRGRMRTSSTLLRRSSVTAPAASFVDFVAAATSLRVSQRGTATSAEKASSTAKEEEEKKASDAKGDKKEEEEGGDGKKKTKEGEKEAEEPRKSFFTQVKEDIVQYPDIYNSINGLHFVLFLVFCLVSTASPSEDSFWKNQLSVSDKFRPLAWWVHSIVTENFMAMAYSMMMLHKLIIQMIAVWGLKRVQTFVLLTSGISGAIMWLGNYGYYQLYKKGKAEKKPEFQYGPWDVMYALLLAQYLHVAIHPIRSILSFDHWLKYASAVGTLYIWYFDWQPTVVGAMVGLVLCKTVPAFKVMPKAAA